MIGAIQITPMIEWNTCLEMIRREIDEADLEADIKEKFLAVLQYYEATWMSKGEIFCLFGYTGPRTTNHAESYHSKQRNHFSPHSKLANWIVSFRELTHTEELDALNVYEGRQVGRRQGRGYAEIAQDIMAAQAALLTFLSSDDGLLRGDRYYYKMHRYLKRMGKLMGIDFVDYRQLTAEEAEMHPAVEQALDENENDQQIEIQPVGNDADPQNQEGEEQTREHFDVVFIED
uniref:Uncharacterized protein n=1 Tax=Ditylenchus dipsaci TaxID=166011 RepID=A0A915EQW5_9BILA